MAWSREYLLLISGVLLMAMCVMPGCGDSPPVSPPNPVPAGTGAVALVCLPGGLDAPWTLVDAGDGYHVGYGDSLLADIPAGLQHIFWSFLPGWSSPEPDTLDVAVEPGDTVTVTGRYEVPRDGHGRLVVTAEPDSLPITWVVTGSDLSRHHGDRSDEMWLPVGDYLFSWNVVPGFVTPSAPLALVLREGETVSVTGRYHRDGLDVGTILVDSEPDGLLASWSLTGPDGIVRAGEGDTQLYGMPAGTYTLDWLEAPAWRTPDPPRVQTDLQGLGTVTFRGCYLSTAPVPVSDFRGVYGTVFNVLEFSWHTVDMVTVPVARYQLLVRDASDDAAEDWSLARVIADIAAPGQAGAMTVALGRADGLPVGAPQRFAVRTIDAQDRASPVSDDVVLALPDEDPVAGRLLDDRGRPLAGIPVEAVYPGLDGVVHRLVTDADGRFTDLELSTNAEVILRTRASDVLPGRWYDFNTGVLTGGAWQGLIIALIPRRGAQPGCPEFDGNFLTYVRYMTRTDHPTNGRPDVRLLKWDRYPVRIFVPDLVNDAGLDMGALCRTGPETWNAILGEDVFTLVPGPGEADVVVRFGTDIPQVNGQVSILEPGGRAFLGDVIPRREEIYISAEMDIPQRVQEVILHECGHVLGIANHTLCQNVGYLMYITSAGALDDGPEHAIHPDEQELVRCLVHLPQGTDMAGYEP